MCDCGDCGCCPGSNGSGSGLCDCCVDPMQYVLEQLIGRVVRIGTTDTSSGTYPSATILDVNDYIITIRQGANTIALPICLVVGVQNAQVQNVLLLPPPLSNEGECDCCERPLRELFDGITTADVDALGQAFNNLSNTQILETGEGIVKLRDNNAFIALSLCKVASVQNFS
ncbi:hypothetical protein CEH05_07260 [Halobacillus halophilus]|uniref:Uncharacterized protein n=1 Tax=Halobacillus halophilus (strain ATCC 35676 / DSM 2266 / JCM 20832 / KCTC 3685 / LMG 17431 / NBRC 102448 / NCIMB 2269) TaxID=866895 RepID=I0JKX7_HALH3|nr:hypothetical protein [Halobacillus halophilus]ASF38921.1 hypothetical protein CEH05_07260 [Halobacillus halophilus]CCG44797.1 conserved hypothetical protein [Halobacillus halophilus DSM 2266]